ncbi:hypothetical protein HRI_000421900 [Hibiscus trionum]|uniref:V-type proton ATPase subunit a n=1 Tax=Hibiscus trionum TaxID=183268 RepID=A0A9W7H0M3_HIBTR|nr:hypothetical protein HRI_000421900 [Hibiscus trionum]
MAYKHRFFEEQMKKVDLLTLVKSLISEDDDSYNLKMKRGELEAELIEMNANHENLQQCYNEVIEYKSFVQKDGEFIHSVQNSVVAKQKVIEVQQKGKGYVDSGIITIGKSLVFEIILSRATRGNAFLKPSPTLMPNVIKLKREMTAIWSNHFKDSMGSSSVLIRFISCLSSLILEKDFSSIGVWMQA